MPYMTLAFPKAIDHPSNPLSPFTIQYSHKVEGLYGPRSSSKCATEHHFQIFPMQHTILTEDWYKCVQVYETFKVGAESCEISYVLV